MENLKLSIFDTFAYVLPGLVILFASVLVVDTTIVELVDIALMVKDINLSTGISAVVGAYIIGFGVDSFGNWLYKFIGFKFWGPPYVEGSVPILKARALVREYSPENHLYLQIWKVMSSMSHNLSFAILVLMVVSIIRTFQLRSLNWGLLSVLSLLLAVIFLHRAHGFDYMHYRDLAEAVEVLHLEKRAIKDAEKSSKDKEAG